jgi:hypothetical protein
VNTNALAKHYGHLTARERLPLIMAAAIRGDEAERQRLMASAPKVRLQVSDHFGLGSALTEVVNLHLLMLLELAASFWQWWGVWLAPKSGTDGQGTKKAKVAADKDREFSAYCMVRFYAYRFLVHVDAWKQFCCELSIDAEAPLSYMPGWDMISRTGEQARELAFAREDATLFILSKGFKSERIESDEGPRVETTEGLAKVWHTVLDEGVKWWAGGSNP